MRFSSILLYLAMRTTFAAVTLAALTAIAGHAAQDPPSFRGRVDLITIDVAAVDSNGRPVEDLRPGDFEVRVDGRRRPTISAELIRVERGTSVASFRPGDALISTNTAPQNARRVIVAVDQTLITPGLITPLLRTASQFVERLTPSDYAAFIAFPEPGPRIDFTTDKAQVVKAMQGIVGQPAKIDFQDVSISLWEAFEMTGAEDFRNKSITEQGPGPTMVRVMERECQNLPDGLDCRRELYNRAVIIAADARHEARISLDALESLLQDLVPLEGPKSMVVFSAGLVNEDPSLLEGVARLAAAARTTINVIAVDRHLDPVRADGSRQTAAMPMSAQDRNYEMAGLELIADNTGGTLFRGLGAGAGIFERLESELSAWYLVAVEREPDDPERQRVEVSVRRRGVSVRSNRTVVATAVNTTRPPDQVLSDALSSPFAIPGVPLRVSTFLQRDSAPEEYRVRLAAQIGQPGERTGEYTVGYLVANERGRAVTTGGSRRTLTPLSGASNEPLHYDTALSVEPGLYTLRFGVVGPDGRHGTVTHRLEVPESRSGDLAASDLIVGNLPANGEPLRPTVEPQVATNELAGYLELYLSELEAERITVTLEIAEGESSPALAARSLTLRAGDAPGTRVANGVVAVTVAPGQYLARASIRRDGEVVRTLVRPISVVRDPAVVTAPAAPRGVPLALDVRQRTAAYVSGVVGRLANIVAEEDFVLEHDRRVTSELLLVRYPGSVADLIPYRDVSEVNGKPVPERQARLLELFVKPTASLRDRARRIMLASDEFVPTAFNPIFALAFLQADYQARFELTVDDAGPEWPAEVKAVGFVEVARPTLLRGGPFGDLDVPTRGTAWIEQATGRILQTELQVGTGRAAPVMVTRFGLDERLQVTVPLSMGTRNPEGEATYRNFRRFEVATDTAVQPGP